MKKRILVDLGRSVIDNYICSQGLSVILGLAAAHPATDRCCTPSPTCSCLNLLVKSGKGYFWNPAVRGKHKVAMAIAKKTGGVRVWNTRDQFTGHALAPKHDSLSRLPKFYFGFSIHAVFESVAIFYSVFYVCNFLGVDITIKNILNQSSKT